MSVRGKDACVCIDHANVSLYKLLCAGNADYSLLIITHSAPALSNSQGSGSTFADQNPT